MPGREPRMWLDESGRLRDPKKDSDGLSVNILGQTRLDDWLSSFKKSFGADSLHCGRVIDLGVHVGQTQQDVREAAGHSVIAGVPYQDEDPARAESLASALAEMSRRMDRTIRKRK